MKSHGIPPPCWKVNYKPWGQHFKTFRHEIDGQHSQVFLTPSLQLRISHYDLKWGRKTERRLATTLRDNYDANWNRQMDRGTDRTTYWVGLTLWLKRWKFSHKSILKNRIDKEPLSLSHINKFQSKSKWTGWIPNRNLPEGSELVYPPPEEVDIDIGWLGLCSDVPLSVSNKRKAYQYYRINSIN